MDEKKREKSQRVVSRLEKDLADAGKEIQALATPTKVLVAVVLMAVMFGVNKRYVLQWMQRFFVLMRRCEVPRCDLDFLAFFASPTPGVETGVDTACAVHCAHRVCLEPDD